eukprot:8041445-Alexandrium_andersonii.AAC.1
MRFPKSCSSRCWGPESLLHTTVPPLGSLLVVAIGLNAHNGAEWPERELLGWGLRPIGLVAMLAGCQAGKRPISP